MKENEKKIELYKIAFDAFNERFLKQGRSIFRLDGEPILYDKSIEYLEENFINNGYAGDASFIAKIKKQLCDTPKNEDIKNIQRDAIEILATAVWLWRLVPFNAKMESTKNSVQEVLDLANLSIDNDSEKKYFDKDRKGIASTGTFYNTNKPLELAYLIRFFKDYINKPEELSEIDILNNSTFAHKFQ